jgi:hypothetical protein
MSDYQKNQIRDGELRRFDRWFVDTAMGPAYRGRDGRVRGVKDDEVARWRADLEAHVDAMIAGLPVQAMWAVGGLLAVVFLGGWLLDTLGIAQHLHGPAIGLAIFIVEAGTVGFETWDYIGGWRERRDGIEAAVAARAPLPVDPQTLGSGHNWYQNGVYAIAGLIIVVALFGHVGGDGMIESGAWGWLFLLVPVAWGLHFAAKAHDRSAKGRLRR